MPYQRISICWGPMNWVATNWSGCCTRGGCRWRSFLYMKVTGRSFIRSHSLLPIMENEDRGEGRRRVGMRPLVEDGDGRVAA